MTTLIDLPLIVLADVRDCLGVPDMVTFAHLIGYRRHNHTCLERAPIIKAHLVFMSASGDVCLLQHPKLFMPKSWIAYIRQLDDRVIAQFRRFISAAMGVQVYAQLTHLSCNYSKLYQTSPLGLLKSCPNLTCLRVTTDNVLLPAEALESLAEDLPPRLKEFCFHSPMAMDTSNGVLRALLGYNRILVRRLRALKLTTDTPRCFHGEYLTTRAIGRILVALPDLEEFVCMLPADATFVQSESALLDQMLTTKLDSDDAVGNLSQLARLNVRMRHASKPPRVHYWAGASFARLTSLCLDSFYDNAQEALASLASSTAALCSKNSL